MIFSLSIAVQTSKIARARVPFYKSIMYQSNDIKHFTLLALTVVVISCIPLISGHVALTYPPARKYDLDFLDNTRTKGPCGMPKGKHHHHHHTNEIVIFSAQSFSFNNNNHFCFPLFLRRISISICVCMWEICFFINFIYFHQ